MSADPLAALEDAISDVGYWRWWTSQLPDHFQVEFGGLQLRDADREASIDPLALRFTGLASVAFLDREARPHPADWPERLAADAIEPFGISHDQFTLTDN